MITYLRVYIIVNFSLTFSVVATLHQENEHSLHSFYLWFPYRLVACQNHDYCKIIDLCLITILPLAILEKLWFYITISKRWVKWGFMHIVTNNWAHWFKMRFIRKHKIASVVLIFKTSIYFIFHNKSSIYTSLDRYSYAVEM